MTLKLFVDQLTDGITPDDVFAVVQAVAATEVTSCEVVGIAGTLAVVKHHFVYVVLIWAVYPKDLAGSYGISEVD